MEISTPGKEKTKKSLSFLKSTGHAMKVWLLFPPIKVIKCQKDNYALKKITNDLAFNGAWKMEYLKEREEFSKTGIPTKKSLQQLPTKSKTVSQSCPTLCDLMDYGSLGPSAHRILYHIENSLGKNTGVGCNFFLQRIFLTQGLNLCLLHCRQILYHLSHQGSFPQVHK